MHIDTELKFIREQLLTSEFFAIVAGSAAIAPQTAGDIDVWLLRCAPLDWLRSQTAQELEADAAWTPTDLAAEERDYQGKLGDYLSPNGTKIQLLMSPAETPDMVLNMFDISTHQWAIAVENPMRAFSLPTSTLPSQLPRVLHITNPASTAQRLVRFCLRYGHPVANHPDTRKLLLASETEDMRAAVDAALHNPFDILTLEDTPF